jgi:hypothetical protein
MGYLQYKFLTIAAIFFLTLSSQVTAEEYTCWINAPEQDDIWVQIYQENDGTRGDTIWAGKITAGEKIKIECKTGSIQYSYKIREDQPIPEHVSTSCDENEEIQLP